jgi:hypothetical protein
VRVLADAIWAGEGMGNFSGENGRRPGMIVGGSRRVSTAPTLRHR